MSTTATRTAAEILMEYLEIECERDLIEASDGDPDAPELIDRWIDAETVAKRILEGMGWVRCGSYILYGRRTGIDILKTTDAADLDAKGGV